MRSERYFPVDSAMHQGRECVARARDNNESKLPQTDRYHELFLMERELTTTRRVNDYDHH